ncbi:MAG: creatininase family protein [Rhodospirillaceae bacterium]|nr:creatininase family protein [Rhodospirillaceae bacterium]
MSEISGHSGGYSIFHETMADMTYPEIAAAARAGAVGLWALGVIEQHGPHLPLATDVYIPSAVLRAARTELAARGIPSVIVPAFYWGVNHVTGRFPGSFQVRPEIMIELMKDVFRSMAKDGFGKLFCLSGHGDALHNRTIMEGVRQGSAAAGIVGRVLASAALARRLGIDPADPHLAIVPAAPAAGPPPAHLDIHAGEYETSMVLDICPGTVRADIAQALPSTELGIDALNEWRKGEDAASRVTPHGYFGNPAMADRARGTELVRKEALAIADAVAASLDGGAA